ncbi:hypothetical protein BZA05DRAFT_408379 [Tricharina praecox]|uniref:uncharacterized protein n=1 Tax=Tricharina praecox TaxID=43433 RepID=UPI0022209C98|nr:uncharacterized protein BZA05DRAFT_408379 [Tricharina praecox]KAI5845391.1 hypothetical protein BZA05DRAFT_408379 [Tricharina praecox]
MARCGLGWLGEGECCGGGGGGGGAAVLRWCCVRLAWLSLGLGLVGSGGELLLLLLLPLLPLLLLRLVRLAVLTVWSSEVVGGFALVPVICPLPGPARRQRAFALRSLRRWDM